MSDKGEIDELESDYGEDEEFNENDPNVFLIRFVAVFLSHNETHVPFFQRLLTPPNL